MTCASVASLVVVTVLSAGAARAAAPLPAEDPALRAELSSLVARRIYFGHKSVGANVMLGVAELAAEAGVPLRIAEVSASLAGAPEAFLHGPVAENGDPLRKLDSFASALASAPAVEIALLKFCYVDFDAGTDVVALFARYQATLESLRARLPGTTFVHLTVPLTTVQGGLKAFVKGLLGRRPYGAAENERREAYNDLVRRAYRGREPLLDVAEIESTAPDGQRHTVPWEGRPVPALVPGYTDDGGHLNAEGRRLVARRLVAALAAVARRPPGAAGP